MLIRCDRPSTLTGWSRVARTRSATARTSWGSASRGQRTTNSSPPIRARESSGRTAARMRRATATRSSSPAWWPRVSLTILKPSRSRKMTATCGPSDCAVEGAELAQELAAVDQPGERVLPGLPVQPRARGPLLRDVVQDHQGQGLARRVVRGQRGDRDIHPAIPVHACGQEPQRGGRLGGPVNRSIEDPGEQVLHPGADHVRERTVPGSAAAAGLASTVIPRRPPGRVTRRIATGDSSKTDRSSALRSASPVPPCAGAP